MQVQELKKNTRCELTDDQQFIEDNLKSLRLPLSYSFFKRFFDLLCAICLIPSLLFCVCVLLVVNPKFNPGPMFFVQPRVGKNGNIIRVFKFRSIPANQDPIQRTSSSDRLSGLSQFIRSSRIDELPQIINVLIGNMSMIGPRPEQPLLYNRYLPEIDKLEERLLVKPGITGLAQLKFGYTFDMEGAARKLNWDRVYIKRMNFGLDTYIFLQTALFVGKRMFRFEGKEENL